MTIYDQIAAHLCQHESVIRLYTCTVTIGRSTYPAARYVVRLKTPLGYRAYQVGQREYEREMIYCIGNLPPAKLHGDVAFNLPGDDTDWYVATYYGTVIGRKQLPADPDSRFAEHHPFGNNFMLAPWNIADSKIDQYERHPYRRVPMTISGKVVRKGVFD